MEKVSVCIGSCLIVIFSVFIQMTHHPKLTFSPACPFTPWDQSQQTQLHAKSVKGRETQERKRNQCQRHGEGLRHAASGLVMQKMQKISNKAKENYIWKLNGAKSKLKASACHEQSACQFAIHSHLLHLLDNLDEKKVLRSIFCLQMSAYNQVIFSILKAYLDFKVNTILFLLGCQRGLKWI